MHDQGQSHGSGSCVGTAGSTNMPNAKGGPTKRATVDGAEKTFLGTSGQGPVRGCSCADCLVAGSDRASIVPITRLSLPRAGRIGAPVRQGGQLAPEQREPTQSPRAAHQRAALTPPAALAGNSHINHRASPQPSVTRALLSTRETRSTRLASAWHRPSAPAARSAQDGAPLHLLGPCGPHDQAA